MTPKLTQTDNLCGVRRFCRIVPWNAWEMDFRSTRTTGRSLTGMTVTRWTEPSEPDLVEFDLSDVAFIDTAALVLLAAVAERSMHDRIPVRFIPPSDPSVARYAARMHLDQCLGELGVEAALPGVQERQVGERLAELRRVTPADADALAESVYGAVIANGGTSQDAKDFFQSIAEVLNNVVDHSGAEGGWAAMQVMPDSGESKQLVTLAVADAGIGLRRSLARIHAVNDDLIALDLAFTPEVSGTEDTRGMGLPDLYERVNRRSGVVRVWSGSAFGTSRRNDTIRGQSTHAHFPGTMIYAALKPQSRERVAG